MGRGVEMVGRVDAMFCFDGLDGSVKDVYDGEMLQKDELKKEEFDMSRAVEAYGEHESIENRWLMASYLSDAAQACHNSLA